jgi:hypothetical protein
LEPRSASAGRGFLNDLKKTNTLTLTGWRVVIGGTAMALSGELSNLYPDESDIHARTR